MARRQALAKRFGRFMPVCGRLSGCFTPAPGVAATDRMKMGDLRGFSDLARAMHMKLRSQWSSI
jgi:hypothetical protein